MWHIGSIFLERISYLNTITMSNLSEEQLVLLHQLKKDVIEMKLLLQALIPPKKKVKKKRRINEIL